MCRRLHRLIRSVLTTAILIWIGTFPAGAQEEQDPKIRELTERRAKEIIQEVLKKKDFKNLTDAYGKVLAAFRREFGATHPLVIQQTENVAKHMYKKGAYNEARNLFQQLVEALTEAEGDDHPSTLLALNNLAIALVTLADHTNALAIQRRIVEALRKNLGEEHLDTLTAKGNLAATLLVVGDLAESRDYHEQVLEAQNRILGTKHPDTLSTKVNLAITLKALGDLTSALVLQEENLKILNEILGPEHADTLRAKGHLASTLESLGELVRARTLQEEVLEARNRTLGDKHPDTLKARANLAVSLYSLGDFEGARVLQEEVLIDRRQILGEHHPDTWKAKANLAISLQALGDLAGARKYQEEDLKSVRQALGEEHLDTLKAKTNLALTLVALDDLASAGVLQEEVVEARSRILGERHLDTLTAAANLAVTLSSLGELAAARTLQVRTLETLSQLFGDEHPDSLRVKANLAITLKAMGALADARQREKELFETFNRILGKEHPETLQMLNNLAISHEEDGDLEKACNLYEKIVEIRRSMHGESYLPTTEEEAKTFLGLGRVYRATGRLAEAQDAFRFALDTIEAQAQLVDLSDEARSRYRALFQDIYHNALEVALDRGTAGQGLLLSERYRTGSIHALLRTNHAGGIPKVPSDTKPELRKLAADYDAITRVKARLHPSRNPEEFRRQADRQIKLRWQREVIQARLLQEYLQGYQPLELEEIRAQVDPGVVLLVYSVGSDQSRLVVMPWEGDLKNFKIDIKRSALWRQVKRFRDLLAPKIFEDSNPDVCDIVGRWLFEKLIGNAYSSIESADRLLILADGPLHYLPFGALVRPKRIPGTWHYLTQHRPIHTVQSVAVYAELRNRRPRVTRIADSTSERTLWVGFGDPVCSVQVSELNKEIEKNGEPSQVSELIFDSEAQGDGRRTLNCGDNRTICGMLKRLPNTRKEVDGIRRRLPKATSRIYLGEQATEDQARVDVRDAHWIHFATHGFALSYVPEFAVDPMDSFLALSLFDEDELKQRQLKHNGLLQAWEIVDLKLAADLVVLSACQTAIGEDRGGDGLISLSRAFQVAGARSVLASLWAVNDQSTAELMIRFYKHLLAGKSKDVALQEAQKEFIAGPIEIVGEDGKTVLHDFSHPYHWAAFQLIGDWQ